VYGKVNNGFVEISVKDCGEVAPAAVSTSANAVCHIESMPNGCWDFGWNYRGGEIKNQAKNSSLACACWCEEVEACEKWTFRKGNCSLKKLRTGLYPSRRSVSGQKNCLNTLPKCTEKDVDYPFNDIRNKKVVDAE